MKKRLRITVNGQTYDVEAEILDDHNIASSAAFAMAGTTNKVPPPAPPSSATGVSSVSSSSGAVASPIAGTVVSIAKPEGSKVAAGEVLLVLEAMKMNTEVVAPCAGTVTSLNVSQGESVEEGQALLIIA